MTMGRSPVQFQPGLSLPAFLERYGTDAQCREALFELRWSGGFTCPEWPNMTGCELARDVYQCHHCRNQSSLTAGTILHATKLALRTWFLAIHLLTQRKKKHLGATALARAGGELQHRVEAQAQDPPGDAE